MVRRACLLNFLHDFMPGPLGEEILRYAKAYRALAERLLDSESVHQTFPGALKALAQTDIIEVSWRRTTGDPGRALLLSPTHPLRLLWHLQHAVVCASGVSAVREGQKAPSPTEFLRQMRVDLTPSNLPLVLFDTRGRGYIDYGSLTPYWSFYLPEPVVERVVQGEQLPQLGRQAAQHLRPQQPPLVLLPGPVAPAGEGVRRRPRPARAVGRSPGEERGH
jgi:hypothetical protein